MIGVSNEGVDVRLLTAGVPWLAVFVLVVALVTTDIVWERWFFGVLTLILGSVTLWFTITTIRTLRGEAETT